MTKKVKLLRIRQVAEMLGVNPETLRRWDRDGTFKAIRIGKRGHRMYEEAEILKRISANNK